MASVGEQAVAGRGEDALSALLRRARSEFIEMPGLHLSIMQAARLWSLDRQTCEDILQRLMAAGFLHKSRGGRYLRTTTV